ncbi:unnamed protein product [Nezara viridula]|uniref:Uncharacterized protein n=1 Tax=Nezara viridula TaxID=85310 RepID=A0A9P0H7H6_NEZVI|nr:unnamed protein product [Nezara viridula]
MKKNLNSSECSGEPAQEAVVASVMSVDAVGGGEKKVVKVE